MISNPDSPYIINAEVAARIVAPTGTADRELRKTVWPGNIAPAFKLKYRITEE